MEESSRHNGTAVCVFGGWCVSSAGSVARSTIIILLRNMRKCAHPSALRVVVPSALRVVIYCCVCLTSHMFTGLSTRYGCNAVPSFSEHKYLHSCGTLGHLSDQEHSVLHNKTLYLLNREGTAISGTVPGIGIIPKAQYGGQPA